MECLSRTIEVNEGERLGEGIYFQVNVGLKNLAPNTYPVRIDQTSPYLKTKIIAK